MPLFMLVILAVVQGVTEFLPISSSAHLTLLHQISGTTPDDIALDVAVHIGSIAAVLLYFRDDARRLARGLVRLGDRSAPEAALARALIVATVPAVVVGGVLALTGWAEALRDVRIIGVTMIVFGIALWWVHRTAPETRPAESWGLREAVIMGLWQAVALIPGVSRSGICITTARAMGFGRHAAARLSMLMSIPITLATGALLARDLAGADLGSGFAAEAGLAALLAFVAAYGALAVMMRFLDRVSFTPYVIYRIALGVVLLAVA